MQSRLPHIQGFRQVSPIRRIYRGSGRSALASAEQKSGYFTLTAEQQFGHIRLQAAMPHISISDTSYLTAAYQHYGHICPQTAILPLSEHLHKIFVDNVHTAWVVGCFCLFAHFLYKLRILIQLFKAFGNCFFVQIFSSIRTAAPSSSSTRPLWN